MVGALGFSASVAPSLYPRPLVSQGIWSGIAVAVGLGVGRAVAGTLDRVRPDRPHTLARPGGRALAAVVTVAVTTWALQLNYRWQVDIRRLMDIDTAAGSYLAAVLPVAAVTAAVLVGTGRGLRRVARRYVRLVSHVVPGRSRSLAHVGIGGLVVVLVVNVVIAGQIVPAVNDRMVAANERSDADVVRPRSAYRSGSRTSLAPWHTLGRMGRRFVATGPTAAELQAFTGTRAVPPIRVYVGLESAPSLRARAELAVAELERTRAFERDVLVFITPTGTGYVNPYATAPLEYLYNGDTAAVAVQYSYLPSWTVMSGNQDTAGDAARAVFAALLRRVRQQPPSERPLLLVYGESLGSFGSEHIFDGLADIRAEVDGVLWVGPVRANRLWRRFTMGRDTASPVWRPVYRRGETVRFGSTAADLARPGGRWTAPRVAYLQHTSDPVTWWTPDLLFHRPDWLREPRPPGISRTMPYLPVVTFVQMAVDLVVGGSAPLGHGHMYGPEQAAAWALVAPPPDWTPADTTRLLAELEQRPTVGAPTR